MKRILLLVTVALMLASALALSGVAQAKPTIGSKADAKCLAEAVRTLGPGFNPTNYTFIGGTEGLDLFDPIATAGPDVFCGFGGNDIILTLAEGDIFLGGAGYDTVFNTNYGTFYGGEDGDSVDINEGTFYGGEGDDSVHLNQGTFNGGPGNDSVGQGFPPVDGPSGT
jgi:Ca2+-binding RTX toxin-like protein